MTTDKGNGMEREYDLLTVGRSSIDLYANEVGAPFTEIKSFAAYVGGCPTNIAVSATRTSITALIVRPKTPTPQRAIFLLPVRVAR